MGEGREGQQGQGSKAKVLQRLVIVMAVVEHAHTHVVVHAHQQVGGIAG
jgi:hypothetical protein